jgi:roadblock/LC7 domain-containing protein
MDHPRDLGMVKDPTALDAFTSKWGIELPSPTQNYNLANKHHYSGTVQVDDTISEAALAALPEYSAPNKTISQMQFRIHEGYVAMSAFVNVPGYPASGPMYTEFSVSATGSQTVAVDFSKLDFGRIGVPGNVVDTVKTAVNDYLNKKILEAGVTIDTLQLHEGGITFKGTWPKTITADPAKP